MPDFELDPALFYSAALNSMEDAAKALHAYPVGWRLPMIANVALSTLRHLFGGQEPTPFQRQTAINLFVQDFPGDEEMPVVVDQLIDAAFNVEVFTHMMEHLEPEEFAIPALLVAPTITLRYPWRPGERGRYIAYLCTFDQAAFTD